jgi:hypothetical protein
MTLFIYFLTFLVLIAVLFYLLDYDYLFNGISKTYLKGKTSANIDDGKFFTHNVIETKSPVRWEEAPEYNTIELPKNIVEDLIHSHTASFIVVKTGNLFMNNTGTATIRPHRLIHFQWPKQLR